MACISPVLPPGEFFSSRPNVDVLFSDLLLLSLALCLTDAVETDVPTSHRNIHCLGCGTLGNAVSGLTFFSFALSTKLSKISVFKHSKSLTEITCKGNPWPLKLEVSFLKGN